MFKYDSVHKTWPGHVEGKKEGLFVEGKKVHTFAERCAGGVARLDCNSEPFNGKDRRQV